jgi:hypothetical protein
MKRFICVVLVWLFLLGFVRSNIAQSLNIIPANEAAAHLNEYATVEAIVAKVFMSKSGNTFLNIGASYPNQTFAG